MLHGVLSGEIKDDKMKDKFFFEFYDCLLSHFTLKLIHDNSSCKGTLGGCLVQPLATDLMSNGSGYWQQSKINFFKVHYSKRKYPESVFKRLLLIYIYIYVLNS